MLLYLLFMLLFCCFRQIICYLLMLQINIFVELGFHRRCFSYNYYLEIMDIMDCRSMAQILSIHLSIFLNYFTQVIQSGPAGLFFHVHIRTYINEK